MSGHIRLALKPFDLLLEQRDDVAPIGTVADVVAAAIEPAKRKHHQHEAGGPVAAVQRATEVVTTLNQKLVTKKNRKVRRLRERYPEIRCKVFYQRDYLSLVTKYGLEDASG